VLSFAYPDKFRYARMMHTYRAPVVYQMASDKLLDCDDELKAAVRALKANMHAFPSLAELAYDCVVVNDLAAALEGLELAPL
jgi:hypothetical protein